VRRERPGTRVILAFADSDAAAYATGGGWLAQALKTWEVEVEIVDIPVELRDEIRAAQTSQTMTNPDSPAEAEDFV
jgi:hypothetical protein